MPISAFASLLGSTTITDVVGTELRAKVEVKGELDMEEVMDDDTVLDLNTDRFVLVLMITVDRKDLVVEREPLAPDRGSLSPSSSSSSATPTLGRGRTLGRTIGSESSSGPGGEGGDGMGGSGEGGVGNGSTLGGGGRGNACRGSIFIIGIGGRLVCSGAGGQTLVQVKSVSIYDPSRYPDCLLSLDAWRRGSYSHSVSLVVVVGDGDDDGDGDGDGERGVCASCRCCRVKVVG